MASSDRMSASEVRASVGLSAIFGLRMLGMFAILPVFALYAEHLPGGNDLTLVGIAIGAYGLTQALLQIPFGTWSDRYGRRPVIYTGLAIFAAGSFIAAFGHHIYVVIAGRILQGAGAISAAVMALAADLTRDEHRTKTMAMIGSTVGAAFALSLVAGPALDRAIGVPGIFVLTGVLAIAAMGVVYAVVPAGDAVERDEDLVPLLSSHEGARAVCLHADPHGTVSSSLVHLDWGAGTTRYLHAAGRPCATPFQDLAAVVG